MRFETIFLVVFFVSLSFASAYDDWGTLDKARRVAACMLYLLNKVVPYVALVLFIFAAVQYLAAADDVQMRLLGKKKAMIAIAGLLSILAFILIANNVFGIDATTCDPST
ncbi:MAG: hypothetical protein GF334_02180 [Candidatus Altiarchaeales archaeon]|nr:hypothetical protein [Candidatus Altiarchaeales archaeon]